MKLRITSNKDLPKWVFGLLFFSLLTAYNVDLRVIKVPLINMSVYQVTWYLFSVLMMVGVLLKRKYRKRNVFLIWSICFISFYLVSLLWSLSSTTALLELKRGLSLYLVFSLLPFYLVSENSVKRVLLANNLALVVCAIYILGVVDTDQIGAIRLGANATGLEAWNANSIGMMMSCGSAVSFYFLLKSRGLTERLIHFGFFLIFVFVTFYSGSRKAFAIMFLAIFVFMWLKNRGVKKLGVVFVALITITVVLYLIMEVPSLYNVLGFRVEIMLDDLFGSGTNDESYLSRGIMIAAGMEWFFEKPFLGYGFTGFAYLFKQLTGRAVYSHNNFVEMLVSGGIVGFIAYYSIYYVLIRKNWNAVLKEKNDLQIMLCSISIALLLAQWANVSYFDPIYFLFTMLSIQLACMQRR